MDIKNFQSAMRAKPERFYDEILETPYWEKQKEITRSVFKNTRTTVKSCHGSGKCLRKDTPILMADGSSKAIQDVYIDDFVMGWDSVPRRVLDISSEYDQMYTVKPKKGMSFGCSKGHMLTLRKGGSVKYNRGGIPNGTIIDISIEDYLKKDNEFKTRWKLFRESVSFKSSKITVDPYFLGIWLGDGCEKRLGVCTIDKEIKDYIYKIADNYGLNININQPKNRIPIYFISGGNTNRIENKLLQQMQKLNIIGNKHIPLSYKTSSRRDRLVLLAGLLDSDGSMANNMFEITQKRKVLAYDIAYIARSLGFAAYVNKRIARIKSIGYECEVYRVTISGDCSIIPTKLKRKQAGKRKQEKNVLNVGFDIRKDGVEKYYGIHIEGDGRHLLGDFTVTHNTYTAARAALAFLFSHKDSIVVTTAPTFRQVENQIWRELRGAYKKAKVNLGGKLLKTKLDVDETWYAIGVSSNDPDNVIGFHAKHVLVVCDEAAGIPVDILDAVEGSLTSVNVHLLYIGNPTIGYGPFYESHKSRMFNKISISVFDTPNFKINGIKNTSELKKFKNPEELEVLKIANENLVTPLWAWGRLQAWGEDSPMYKAKVEAIFPEEGADTLIGLNYVEQALVKEFKEDEWKFRPRCNVIGIDVARFGDDNTVFTVMDNLQIVDLDWHNGKDTMKTAGKAIILFKEYGFSKEFDTFVIDDTGVGGGVTDRLVELGYNVIPVNFGNKSDEPDVYANLKAEIFWNMRTVFRNGEIAIIDRGKLVGEIPSVRYDMTSKGQIAIVDKKTMKKEGLGSPDFADSLALAVYGVLLRGSGGSSIPDESVGKGVTAVGNINNEQF